MAKKETFNPIALFGKDDSSISGAEQIHNWEIDRVATKLSGEKKVLFDNNFADDGKKDHSHNPFDESFEDALSDGKKEELKPMSDSNIIKASFAASEDFQKRTKGADLMNFSGGTQKSLKADVKEKVNLEAFEDANFSEQTRSRLFENESGTNFEAVGGSLKSSVIRIEDQESQGTQRPAQNAKKILPKFLDIETIEEEEKLNHSRDISSEHRHPLITPTGLIDLISPKTDDILQFNSIQTPPSNLEDFKSEHIFGKGKHEASQNEKVESTRGQERPGEGSSLGGTVEETWFDALEYPLSEIYPKGKHDTFSYDSQTRNEDTRLEISDIAKPAQEQKPQREAQAQARPNQEAKQSATVQVTRSSHQASLNREERDSHASETKAASQKQSAQSSQASEKTTKQANGSSKPTMRLQQEAAAAHKDGATDNEDFHESEEHMELFRGIPKGIENHLVLSRRDLPAIQEEEMEDVSGRIEEILSSDETGRSSEKKRGYRQSAKETSRYSNVKLNESRDRDSYEEQKAKERAREEHEALVKALEDLKRENIELALRLKLERENKQQEVHNEASKAKNKELILNYEKLERMMSLIQLENEDLNRRVALSHKEMERSQTLSSESLQSESLQLKKALTTLKKESDDIRNALEKTSGEMRKIEELEELTNSVKKELIQLKTEQKAIAEERDKLERVSKETLETQRRERERVNDLHSNLINVQLEYEALKQEHISVKMALIGIEELKSSQEILQRNLLEYKKEAQHLIQLEKSYQSLKEEYDLIKKDSDGISVVIKEIQETKQRAELIEHQYDVNRKIVDKIVDQLAEIRVTQISRETLESLSEQERRKLKKETQAQVEALVLEKIGEHKELLKNDTELVLSSRNEIKAMAEELDQKLGALKSDLEAERLSHFAKLENEKTENLRKITILESCLNESNQQILSLKELFNNMKGEVESITKDVSTIKDQEASNLLKSLPKNSRVFQSSEEYVRSLVGELQFSPEKASSVFKNIMTNSSDKKRGFSRPFTITESPSPIKALNLEEPATPSKTAQPTQTMLSLKSPLQYNPLESDAKELPITPPDSFRAQAPVISNKKDPRKALSDYASKVSALEINPEAPLIDSLRNESHYQGLGPDPYFIFRTYQEHSSSLNKGRKYNSPVGSVEGRANESDFLERTSKSIMNFDLSGSIFRTSNALKMRDSSHHYHNLSMDDRLSRTFAGGGSAAQMPRKKRGTQFFPGKFMLNKIVTMMQTSVAFFKNDLMNFKLTCFLDSALLFENHELQIGVKTYREAEGLNENSLKLVLFFTNKLKQPMENLHIRLRPYGKKLASSPPDITLERLDPLKNTKQEVIAKEDSNFDASEFAFVNISFLGGLRHMAEFNIPLPTTINKFFDMSFVDATLFKQQWKALAGSLLYVENITLSSKLVSTPADLKRLLSGIIEVTKPDENRRTTKFIGMLKVFRPEFHYHIKLVVRHSRSLRFAIGARNLFDSDARRIAEQIINTLVFLLTE